MKLILATLLIVSFSIQLEESALGAEQTLSPRMVRIERLKQFEGLDKAVTEYYIAENKKDWLTTYYFRTDDFQNIVPFSVYNTAMSASGQDVYANTIEIIAAEYGIDEYLGDPIVIVSMRFVDQFRGNRDGLIGLEIDSSKQLYENVISTIWIKENKEWRCRDCGVRLHFDLNGRMRY